MNPTSYSVTRLWLAAMAIVVVLWAMFGTPGTGLAMVMPAMAPAQTPKISIDTRISLKANATLGGTATGTAGPMHVVVVDNTPAAHVVYDNPMVPTVQGVWSAVVYPPLSNGLYHVAVSSGRTVATSSLVVGLQTSPRIVIDPSLPASDISDGHLMHFAISAAPSGPVGIGQLSFLITPSNATVDSVLLYAFSDSGYTMPISSASTTDGLLNSTSTTPADTAFVIVPDTPVEIPAGHTYYFALEGVVQPTDTTYFVETALVGDQGVAAVGTQPVVAASSSVVWTPNTYGTSSPQDADWVNASVLADIPHQGLVVTRANDPAPAQPSCSVGISTTTAAFGQKVVVTWDSTDAQTLVWSDGAAAQPQGSKTITMGSTTTTYILNVSNQFGQAQCFQTVAAPRAAVATTTAITTPVVLDTMSVFPKTGVVPLKTSFVMTLNTAQSCAALTYTLGFGDNSSSAIKVPLNTCKVQTVTISHTYIKLGTYTAGLYSGTGTSTKQLISKQVVTVKTTLAVGQANMTANALNSMGGWVGGLWKQLAGYFRK